MAGLMGVTAEPFEGLFEAKVVALQSKMLTYVCHLADTKNPRALKTQTEIPSCPDLQVLLNAAGYPIMPDRPADKVHQKKKELALVMHKYLNAHYSKRHTCRHNLFTHHSIELASAHKTDATPFTKVASHTAAYIDPEYLPAGWEFQDPSNAQKEVIAAFIDHIRAQQSDRPLDEVFKWKAYQIDRQGTLALSQYGKRGDPDLRAKKMATQRLYRASVQAWKAEVHPLPAKPTEMDRPWRADGMDAHYDQILAENTRLADSNGTDTGDPTQVDMPGHIQTLGTHYGRPRRPANGSLQTPPPDTPMAHHTLPVTGANRPAPEGMVEVTQEVYHRVRELNPGLIIPAHNGPESGQLPQHYIPEHLYEAFLANSAYPPANDRVPDSSQHMPHTSTALTAGVPAVSSKVPRGRPRGRPPGKRHAHANEHPGHTANVTAITPMATPEPEGQIRRSQRTQHARATALPHNRARGRGRKG